MNWGTYPFMHPQSEAKRSLGAASTETLCPENFRIRSPSNVKEWLMAESFGLEGPGKFLVFVWLLMLSALFLC